MQFLHLKRMKKKIMQFELTLVGFSVIYFVLTILIHSEMIFLEVSTNIVYVYDGNSDLSCILSTGDKYTGKYTFRI